jgi:hypothetical protein
MQYDKYLAGGWQRQLAVSSQLLIVNSQWSVVNGQ